MGEPSPRSAQPWRNTLDRVLRAEIATTASERREAPFDLRSVLEPVALRIDDHALNAGLVGVRFERAQEVPAVCIQDDDSPPLSRGVVDRSSAKTSS